MGATRVTFWGNTMEELDQATEEGIKQMEEEGLYPQYFGDAKPYKIDIEDCIEDKVIRSMVRYFENLNGGLGFVQSIRFHT